MFLYRVSDFLVQDLLDDVAGYVYDFMLYLLLMCWEI